MNDIDFWRISGPKVWAVENNQIMPIELTRDGRHKRKRKEEVQAIRSKFGQLKENVKQYGNIAR